MALAIVAHAERFDRHPEEVLDDYLEHPRSYQLRWAFRGWRNKREQPPRNPRR